MSHQRKGFTTVVDLTEFEKITWSFLTNVKMTWEYDGIAYLFREKGIPLYGMEKGTTKMNHPVMGMLIPPSKDKNFGVDIYVPKKSLAKATKLIADRDRVRECAELEAEVGQEHYDQFNAQARAAKGRYDRLLRERRRERLASFLSLLSRN